MRDKLIKFRGDRSQEEMSKIYNVSQQLWSKWERGLSCPSPAKMFLIEKDSGIPMEELFFDSFNNLMELKNNLSDRRSGTARRKESVPVKVERRVKGRRTG